MLEQAFEALTTYDWGQDPNLIKPIDEAVVATQDDAPAREQLEKQLVAALEKDSTFDAKQYLCRKLMVLGTAICVPALEQILADEELSHMARYALERIPADEAAQALRDAAKGLSGELQIGALASLGARRDERTVPLAAELLADADPEVARAAALTLGAIRTPAAAEALASSGANEAVQSEIADARLACAESLLASGNATDAAAIYRGLMAGDQPKHIKVAATRGMLNSAKRK